MKTNNIGRKETMRVDNYIVTITARLCEIGSNGYEDFGITYDLWEDHVSPRTWMAGGCAAGSDDPVVRKAMRQFGLEPVERVHLSDMNGAPMYPTANAIYHAKNSGFEVFRDYLRLTDDEARTAVCIDNELGLYVWLLDNGIIERWKKEANEAIAAIINSRDIEFESKARKPQGHWHFNEEPTEERMDAQRELFRRHYYNSENYKLRRQEESLAECLKSLDQSIGYCQKQIDEEEMRIKIKQAMRDAIEGHFLEFKKPILLIDNSIFYQHRNEIAFNWRNFSDKVNDEDYELMKKYLEPFCKENNLTISKKG